MFPGIITIIYNQRLKRGYFPKSWKIAEVIPITKHANKNILDPSKYRPISLLNMGGKILDKLLINRINYRLYKNELLTKSRYGFTPQKSTIDATMEAKSFIEPMLENRGLVIMTSLDIQGAFVSAWWPGILQGLRDFKCPRNLYKLSKEFFNDRTVVMITKNYSIERRIKKERPQVPSSGSGFWNVLYNALLTLELTSRSKAIAFADDLIILSRGESVAEAENYEFETIQEWAQNNKIKFNENKSKLMLMSRRERKEKRRSTFTLRTKHLNKSTA